MQKERQLIEKIKNRIKEKIRWDEFVLQGSVGYITEPTIEIILDDIEEELSLEN